MENSIQNTKDFQDVKGNPIQAHGSKIYRFNDEFYWIGENKELTDGENGIWHNGVNCYHSNDFIHWDYDGIIVNANDIPESTLNRISKMDRPHVLYNEKYDYFVMWLKIQNEDGSQDMTILKAPKITGPYELIKEHYHPFEFSTGDFDLVIEGDSAYWIYEIVHSGLGVSRLDDEYLKAIDFSILENDTRPPYTRESPVYFTVNHRHFLVTSGTTSYFPNPSMIYELENITGPIIKRYRSHMNDANSNSFNSQMSGVVKVNDKLMFVADIWYPDNKISYETIEEIFNDLFSGKKEKGYAKVTEIRNLIPKDCTRDSKYMFYEITMIGDNPYFEYKETIALDK